MVSPGLPPLCRSSLTNRGSLHTWCQCSLVSILGEEGNYCIKVLIWVCLTAVTTEDNLSHLMPLSRYQIFDPGSRSWYPYSTRFPRIILYLTCWAIYCSQSHAFFSPSYIDIWSAISVFDPVALIWFGLTILNGWNKTPLCCPSWTSAVRHMDTDQCFCRSDHRHFCCLSFTLLYAP